MSERTRMEQRRLDVAFEAIMADTAAWKAKGRPATARDKLEQAVVREPIYRAAAAGQLTEREFHLLHGYKSVLYGFLMGDQLRRVEPWSAARTLRQAATL